MYKLIAIDMDGTLLKEDRTISERTKKVLKKVTKLGVKVVLTSGRPIQGIRKYMKELEFAGEDDYVIGLNGAVIYKADDYSVINSSNTLKGKDLKYIYSKVKGLNTYIHAFTSKEDLVSKISRFSDDEEKRVNLPIRVTDFLNEVDDEDEILKVILEEEKEILDKIIPEIPTELLEKYKLVSSLEFMLEFINKECSKAAGLQKLAQHLEINREDIIAIGDANNDVEMIEYAGLGVAMGNAKEEIKNIADFITKSNEEDGAAYAMEKFILNIYKND